MVLRATTDPLTATLQELGEPPGLSLRSVEDLANLTVTGPMLAHLDVAAGSALDEPAAWQLVASLAPGKAREALLTLPPATAEQVTDYRTRLRKAGLAYAITVELADNHGHAQLLLFATGDIKHLATFKNELWAADEFAGIRYRDPRDADWLSRLIPLRYIVDAVREAFLGNFQDSQLLRGAAITIGLAAVSVTLAVRTFRRQSG